MYCNIMFDKYYFDNYDHFKLPLSFKTTIGLGVPVLGKGIGSIRSLPLIKYLIPTLNSTISSNDLENFRYVLYIGFDRNDNFFKKYKNRVEVLKYIEKYFPGQRILAMSEGCDYFYQLNDDVKFLDEGWSDKFTRSLSLNEDFGVVGPCDIVWNCKLLTQAMVSRKHYEIFGWLYPVEIKDWFSDNWLTNVYGGLKQCSKSIRIQNIRKGGSRYAQCRKPRWRYLVEQYKSKIPRLDNV
ncbi:hypothetical protein O9G_004643 [Rozella allomycis CSF55]|uniref:Uncharacterized protein n=1 Tax=Rozella allomycis (strain CSF55) TaxID=988480 RepID=A0A075AMX3_ROZAC|nr:hypothetical protein O9G_004643 [Rozella allomycis CSF55]|eukprot:EPZ31069.1 hypothetical protein O9G_004643 [Rozella allomycis CSF55]